MKLDDKDLEGIRRLSLNNPSSKDGSGRMNKIQIKELLQDISNDLQVKCEDNEILRAEIEDYFEDKIKEVEK